MLVVIAVWNVTVWCGAEQGSLFLPLVHVMLYRWQLKYIFTEKSTQHIKKQCITEILVIHLCNTVVKPHVLGRVVYLNVVLRCGIDSVTFCDCLG